MYLFCDLLFMPVQHEHFSKAESVAALPHSRSQQPYQQASRGNLQGLTSAIHRAQCNSKLKALPHQAGALQGLVSISGTQLDQLLPQQERRHISLSWGGHGKCLAPLGSLFPRPCQQPPPSRHPGGFGRWDEGRLEHMSRKYSLMPTCVPFHLDI